jgi:hypothetical protein
MDPRSTSNRCKGRQRPRTDLAPPPGGKVWVARSEPLDLSRVPTPVGTVLRSLPYSSGLTRRDPSLLARQDSVEPSAYFTGQDADIRRGR